MTSTFFTAGITLRASTVVLVMTHHIGIQSHIITFSIIQNNTKQKINTKNIPGLGQLCSDLHGNYHGPFP